MPEIQSCKNCFILTSRFEGLVQTGYRIPALDTMLSESEKMPLSLYYIQSMSAYKAMSVKKQQKSKYNLCKHQFRGNLKIKNSWISSKQLVGIESDLSQKILLSFLNHKPLSELLKTFSSIQSLL